MKTILSVLLLFLPLVMKAQFGVDYHQSSLPFIGFNYEIKDRVRPELRLGTDSFTENIPVEFVVTYDIINKPDYEFYVGLGGRGGNYDGLVVPIGLAMYPLPNKKFGLHIEVAPIAIGESSILRGSWGVRYRFLKPEPDSN